MNNREPNFHFVQHHQPDECCARLVETKQREADISDVLPNHHARLRRSARAASVTSSTGTVSTTPTLKNIQRPSRYRVASPAGCQGALTGFYVPKPQYLAKDFPHTLLPILARILTVTLIQVAHGSVPGTRYVGSWLAGIAANSSDVKRA